VKRTADEKAELTTEDGLTLEDILGTLTISQIEWCSIRVHLPSDAETNRKLGYHPTISQQWKKRGYRIDDAVRLLKIDGIITTNHLLHRHAVQAAVVKVKGLRSKSEKIQQAAATEILDRVVGKPVQKNITEGTFDINSLNTELPE
jgi:hypothetical protein